MPKPSLDLTGREFGQLTVAEAVEPVISPGGVRLSCWLCRCTCGGTVVVRATHLLSGNTRSCGCLHREAAAATCQRTGVHIRRLKVCVGCGVEFMATASQKYHSQKCKEAATTADRSQLKCLYCGNVIAAKKRGPVPRYCDKRCREWAANARTQTV